MNRLLIVDGHAYAYRAFYAIRELHSPSGQPTNAIYGFIKMLGKMRATIKPTHLIVVWDGGLSVQRMAALPGYKAQRPEMPDNLKPQLDQIAGYLRAARIASYQGEGVEADDYIACLTRHALGAGMTVVIASSDKDFMQLVSPQVGLLNPNDKSETVWKEQQVRAKTGVNPSQIVDWLALMGDSVDNIPGVPGVGAKTAADLLNRFGTVAELLVRLDEVKQERLQSSLRASVEVVIRNLNLVRLRDDLPCDFSPTDLVEMPADAGQLGELFRRWGFKRMLEDLDAGSGLRQAVLI